ncbi:MAG: glycosyltransferase [Nanoarchaeota archaeon]
MVKKYSIVSILTLDRLNLTKKAVNSILEKSVEDVKIIFFDNGSKDGTIPYLNKLKDAYPSKIDFLKSETNLGVAAGRNKILRHVISNYGDNWRWTLNLDNDCIVHEGYDVALTDCFQETRALAVCPKLIQPDGRIFHNAYNGFLINLNYMQLKLEYADNVDLRCDDPKVSKRIESDVILGTSAKTPEFLHKVGFYDEGHKIGWEDFSIALKAFGLKKEYFLKWKQKNKHRGENWVPLRQLMNNEKNLAKLVIYEPSCKITHDHPVTNEHADYEKIRWRTETIHESTNHFEDVWGIRPIM